MAFCSGVAAKVARFSLTMRQGGVALGQIVDGRDVAPERVAPASPTSIVDQPVGGADGDRQAVGKGENPFRRAADQADDQRQLARRGELESAR